MRGPCSSLGLLAFRSVEFSSNLPFADLATLPSPPTHYVLPDLPGIVADDVKNDFRSRTSCPANGGDTMRAIHQPKPIMTIAASLHESPMSLINAAKQRLEVYKADTLLIVGGNTMKEDSITTSEAIKLFRDTFPPDTSIFCTWDPNSTTDLDLLLRKIDAGATGIITQPPLTSMGWDQLDGYCSNAIEGIDLIPGVCLPKSSKQLLFWSSLLKEPQNAENDEWFCNALHHFNDPAFDIAARQSWAMEQRDRLLSYDSSISGLHFMPLGNKDDMLTLMR